MSDPQPPPSSSLWCDIGRRTGPLRSPVSNDANPAIVKLGHFAPVAKISFGDVRLGVEGVATISLQNPQGFPQTVWFEKFPKDKGLTLELEESSVFIPANGNVNVHVKWCPAVAGNFREVILIKGAGNFRTNAILLGAAIDTAQSKKKSGRGRPKLATLYPTNSKPSQHVTNSLNQKSRSPNIKMTTSKSSTSTGNTIDNQVTSDKVAKGMSAEGPSGIFQNAKDIDQVLMSGTFVIQKITSDHNGENENYNLLLTPQRRLTITKEPATSNTPKSVKRLDLEGSPKPTTELTFVCNKTGNEFACMSADELPSCEDLSTSLRRQTYTKEEVLAESPKQKFALSTLQECSDMLEVSTVQEPVEHLQLLENPTMQFYPAESAKFPNPLLKNLDDMFAFSPDTNALFQRVSRPSSIAPLIPRGMERRETDFRRLQTQPGTFKKPESQEFAVNRQKPPSGFEAGNTGSHAVEITGDISGIESISEDVIWKRTPAEFTLGNSLGFFDTNVSEISNRRCSTACRGKPPNLHATETPIMAEPVASTAGICMNADHIEQMIPTHSSPKIKRFNEEQTNAAQGANRMKRKSVMSPNFKKKRTAQEKLVLLHPPQRTSIPRHPNPFVSKNTFYDEQWREKQESGFVRWLNYILTPPDGLNASVVEDRLGDPNTWLRTVCDTDIQRAPSREHSSLKAYMEKSRLNCLRRMAVRLYQSAELSAVVQRIEIEISSSRLKIRKDKAIDADIGMKEIILKLLLGYNLLWLRIGIETILGEIINLQSNGDKLGMARFINQRFLFDAEVARRFAHPSIQQYYRPGYDEAYKRVVLRRILLLVFFLDCAKNSQLIQHDPCLFSKDAAIKSSQGVLVEFSRLFMSGEGDIIKHLRYLGYPVSHKQVALHEFEFATSNLAVDLRDGLRLTRVVQVLIKDAALLTRMRVPALSRLQKIHNVGVVLETMNKLGHPVREIAAKDIVDGNRDKTLALLWHIVINFQLNVVLDDKRLEEEVAFLRRSFYLRRQLLDNKKTDDNNMEVDGSEFSYGSRKLFKLFQWCHAVCRNYNMNIRNFTVSFSDGRAFCYLLHHYHPDLLPLNEISKLTTHTFVGDGCNTSPGSEDSFNEKWGVVKFESEKDASAMSAELLANEQSNFKLFFQKVSELAGVPVLVRQCDMSNTIPDEKVTVTQLVYLCTRLLSLRAEIRASRTIQMAWRKYKIKETCKQRIRNEAAFKIQRFIREMIRRKRARVSCTPPIVVKEEPDPEIVRKKEEKIIRCQAIVRGFLARRNFLELKAEIREKNLMSKRLNSAVVIQKAWRRLKCVKTKKQLLQGKIKAAVVLQKYWRGRKARITVTNLRAELHQKLENAAAAEIRELENRRIAAAAVLQKYWRGRKARILTATLKKDLQEKDRTAILIQNWWRMTKLTKSRRQDYLKLKNAAVIIQRWWRRVSHGVPKFKGNTEDLESTFFSCRSNSRRSSLLLELPVDEEIVSSSHASLGDVTEASLFESFWTCGDTSMNRTSDLDCEDDSMVESGFRDGVDSVIEASGSTIVCEDGSMLEQSVLADDGNRHRRNIFPEREDAVDSETVNDEKAYLSAQEIKLEFSESESSVPDFNIASGDSALYETCVYDRTSDLIQVVCSNSKPSEINEFNHTMGASGDVPIIGCDPALEHSDNEHDGTLSELVNASLSRFGDDSQTDGTRNRAAAIIQAAWREYSRKRATREVEPVANLMTAADKLRNDLEFLLKCRQLTTIFQTLLEIEKSSRADAVYCELCVSADACRVLITLMRGCNRSVPHKDLIGLCTNILHNIAVHESLLPRIWGTDKLLDTLLKMMSVYFASGPTIFTKCCHLLKLFLARREYLNAVRLNVDWMDRIRSMNIIVRERWRNAERLRRRKFAAPDNPAADRKHFEEFVQPASAIFSILETLLSPAKQ